MIKSLLTELSGDQKATRRSAIILAATAGLSGALLLAISGWFLVGAAVAGSSGASVVRSFNYLLPSAAIRGLAILRTASRYGERLTGHMSALRTLAKLRPILFARFAQSTPQKLLSHRSGEVATRLGAEVDQLENDMVRQLSLPAIWASAMVGTGGAFAMGGWALLPWLLGLFMMRFTGTQFFGTQLDWAARQMSTEMADLKSSYADMARASADIAIYDLASPLADAMNDVASRHDKAKLHFAAIEALLSGMQVAIPAIVIAVMILVSNAPAPILALGALAAIAAMEVWGQLMSRDIDAPRRKLAMELLETLASDPSDRKASVATSLVGKSISFGADTARILLGSGQRIAIIGPSGSGKSRLIETLLGLREDAPELLEIDGADPRQLPISALRGVFAPALQEPGLIAGTVADNLRLARPGLTDTELWKALETACADAFVRSLPGQLEHWIGEGGARLSGGQQRRLAVARALLAGRNWLVLDEPSEGLDGPTEAALVANLDQWLAANGIGLILISHRPAMLQLTDKHYAVSAEMRFPR
ncbi:MAG: ATP-binding cassette domain-containing protein [Sphingomonadales bacterium]|nr:ATP-binding cassette domain-containing protein [Sphingomonadales bacterium]